MSLDWQYVDLRQGWVNFKAETRKGSKQDNALPIAQDTVDALKKLKRTEGLVFHWPYSEGYIYRRVGRIMRRAGLPDTREFKFHAIRKSTASHYEAAGGNATELLGHSSRKVTESYLDPRICKPQPAVELLFRPGEVG